MRLFVAVAILLAATAASAQVLKSSAAPAAVLCKGCTTKNKHVSGGKATGRLQGRRKVLSSATSKSRKLLGDDGTGTASSQIQYLYKLCPTTGNAAYDLVDDPNAWYTAGQLVLDNGVCVTAAGTGTVVTKSNSSGAIYGGAAQDYGSYKPTWETYAWSLFKLSDTVASSGDILTTAWIQGINLHLIGAVGTNHDGSSCNVTAISFGIYDADQASPYNVASSTPVYQQKVDVTTGHPDFPFLHSDFVWNSNTSQYYYTDIYNINDNSVNSLGFELDVNKYYWLRVKVFTELTATKRCFAFWAMSSTPGNDQGVKARWQESIGGAKGYSTTCLGAADSPTSLPGQYQTMWNCWNNGVGTVAYTPVNAPLRRCATFRQSTVPPLVTLDCRGTATVGAMGGAQFNDFNYAFVGTQGQVAVAGGK